jgi:hypothetical protein
MARVVTLIGVGILCSAVWLELLVATRFATITVSLGLLGALVVIGMSERPDRTTD